MTRFSTLVFLAAVLNSVPLDGAPPMSEQTCGEALGRGPIQATPVIVPFRLTEFNNISVSATLNGTDALKLMLHTAVSGVAITEAAAAKAATIKWDKSGNIVSWGGKAATRFSTNNFLQIGQLSWDKLSIVEDSLSGNQTDGKFGCDLFEGKVIEIDFDRHVIVIHPALPSIDPSFERLDVTVVNSNLFVEGSVLIGSRQHRNRFLIHTGFGGTVLFDNQFVKANVPPGALRNVGERQLKDSLGNVLTTKTVILPALTFGRTTFRNVPIGLFEGKIGDQQMSVLGGELLKRFNILLDMKKAQLYLKPNGLFAQDFRSRR